MRQLGKGQRLLVVGMPDVTEKIWAAGTSAAKALAAPSSGSRQGHATQGSGSTSTYNPNIPEPDMEQVLQWTMDNTVKASQAGLPEWAAQGARFAATADVPQRALQPEKLQLSDL